MFLSVAPSRKLLTVYSAETVPCAQSADPSHVINASRSRVSYDMIMPHDVGLMWCVIIRLSVATSHAVDGAQLLRFVKCTSLSGLEDILVTIVSSPLS